MTGFNDITVKIKELEGNSGTFEISPLPRGYGNTLTNSLRRILLSSLVGSGITSIKINGIEHEYSTIEGVKEDIVQIILNLKSVKFKAHTDEPQVCYLEVSGEKLVTAADIKTTGMVEVVTPEVEIATLTDASSVLKIEIVVEKGVGYQEADQGLRSEIGRLPLDTDFSPVNSVSFDVVRARKGQLTNLDGVEIKIETDGSIEPKQALIDAGTILQEFAGKVIVALGVSKEESDRMAEESRKIDVVAVADETASDEVTSWKVEDLPISKRSKSGLLAGGFNTVGDIAKASLDDLLSLPGFGNKSLSEIVDLMTQYGIKIEER